jgi:hypothetical protein
LIQKSTFHRTIDLRGAPTRFFSSGHFEAVRLFSKLLDGRSGQGDSKGDPSPLPHALTMSETATATTSRRRLHRRDGQNTPHISPGDMGALPTDHQVRGAHYFIAPRTSRCGRAPFIEGHAPRAHLGTRCSASLGAPFAEGRRAMRYHRRADVSFHP